MQCFDMNSVEMQQKLTSLRRTYSQTVLYPTLNLAS